MSKPDFQLARTTVRTSSHNFTRRFTPVHKKFKDDTHKKKWFWFTPVRILFSAGSHRSTKNFVPVHTVRIVHTWYIVHPGIGPKPKHIVGLECWPESRSPSPSDAPRDAIDSGFFTFSSAVTGGHTGVRSFVSKHQAVFIFFHRRRGLSGGPAGPRPGCPPTWAPGRHTIKCQ